MFFQRWYTKARNAVREFVRECYIAFFADMNDL